MCNMRLSEYLKVKGMTHEDFARRVDVSVSYVTYLVQGKRKPSFDLLVNIHKETDGAVTFNDFI